MVNSDNLNDLYPYVKYLAEKLIQECIKQKINIKIYQTYRDIEYQNYLYTQGRTKSGTIITNAKGGSSFHNYKLAFDFCINDKEDSWNKVLMTKVGQIGKSLGLEWGGDFKSIRDMPHFQYSEGLTISDLKNGKRPKRIDDVPNSYEFALQRLYEKHIISDLKYWNESFKNNKEINPTYVSKIILQLTNKNNLSDSMKFLVENKIIKDPTYWINCIKDIKSIKSSYLKVLLINAVNILKV